MTIVITLSPEIEAQLRDRAAQQGRDISLVAAELLTNVLEWEAIDYQEAIEGIQKGLDDYEAGHFRSFNEFADEQRNKYNLPIDS
jgi:predicted transcriptional regulator